MASQQHLSRLRVMFEHVIKWVPPTLAYASLKDSFLARLTIYLPLALHADWRTWEPQTALTIFSRQERGLIGLEHWFPGYFNWNDQRTEGKHVGSGAGVRTGYTYAQAYSHILCVHPSQTLTGNIWKHAPAWPLYGRKRISMIKIKRMISSGTKPGVNHMLCFPMTVSLI